MKTINTLIEKIEFVNQNFEFLDFVYMEGIWQGRKGYASIEVNENFELYGGGFVDSDRKGMKFSTLDNKSDNNQAKKTITGYYVISKEGEFLFSIRRKVNYYCNTGVVAHQ